MDTTPAGLYDAYDLDFQHIAKRIKEQLETEARQQQGEQRKATLRKVEMSLDEADDIISQLEIEIQGIPISVRSPYGMRLKQAKADIHRFKKLSKELHSQGARGELLGRGGNARFNTSVSDDPYSTSSDRLRLLAGTETLSDGNRRLLESQRIAHETEEQGADILRRLVEQRDQIENSRNMLGNADTSIDRANVTIKDMLFQMKKQRFVIGGITIVLVLVILLILYFKLVR